MPTTLWMLLLLTAAPTEVSRLPPGTRPALRGLAASCDAADVQACIDLGFRFEDGLEFPTDEAHAAALLQRACDLSKPGTGFCRNALARPAKTRAGKAEVAVGPRAPLKLRQAAIRCDLYEAESCADTAGMLDPPGPLALAEQVAFLDVGCSRGSDTACLAKAGVASDFQKACSTRHDAEACRVAQVYGAAPSKERAEGTPRLLGAIGGGGVLFSKQTEPTCRAALARIVAGKERQPGLAALPCQELFALNADFRNAFVATMKAPADQRCLLFVQAVRELDICSPSGAGPVGCREPTRLVTSTREKACAQVPSLLRAALERTLSPDISVDSMDQAFAPTLRQLFPAR